MLVKIDVQSNTGDIRKLKKINNRTFSGIYDDHRGLTDFYIYKYDMSYLFEIVRTKVKQWDNIQSILTSSPWSGSQRRSKMGHFEESMMIVESWLTFTYINMACPTFLKSLGPK